MCRERRKNSIFFKKKKKLVSTWLGSSVGWNVVLHTKGGRSEFLARHIPRHGAYTEAACGYSSPSPSPSPSLFSLLLFCSPFSLPVPFFPLSLKINKTISSSEDVKLIIINKNKVSMEEKVSWIPKQSFFLVMPFWFCLEALLNRIFVACFIFNNILLCFVLFFFIRRKAKL